MEVKDKRLDREVSEVIGATTTLTETDLRSYRRSDFDDRDHEYYDDRIDEVVDKLEENETTRRAIVLADDPTMCMVGVHVLIRDKLHVLAWMRASDADKYRDDDVGFLYSFGRKIRKQIGSNKRIMLHVFTSSLHSEIDGGIGAK